MSQNQWTEFHLKWDFFFVEFPGIQCNKRAWAHTHTHKCFTSFYIIGTNWREKFTSEMNREKKIKKNPHAQTSFSHSVDRKCSPWLNKKNHKCTLSLPVMFVSKLTSYHTRTTWTRKMMSLKFICFGVVFYFSFNIFELSNYTVETVCVCAWVHH